MNIQSSLNSMLGTIEGIARISYAGKQLGNIGTGLGETKEAIASQAEATREVAKEQRKSSTEQAQYNRDIAKMLRKMREEKERGEALQVVKQAQEVEKQRNQKTAMADRKEYARKPRVINRHGVIM